MAVTAGSPKVPAGVAPDCRFIIDDKRLTGLFVYQLASRACCLPDGGDNRIHTMPDVVTAGFPNAKSREGCYCRQFAGLDKPD